MLETVEAETFLRQMTAGRNKPVALGCARSTNSGNVTCIVKLPPRLQGMAPLTYLLEWFSAEIARAVGIVVPQSFCVRITEPFARSVQKTCPEMMGSVGDVFGSEHCAGFSQWTRGALLPIELRPAAAEILAFDVFVQNVDRRADNPNLLASQDSFVAFDHDMAFAFLFPIKSPDPSDAMLDMIPWHVFGGCFGRKAPSLARFRDAVEQLNLPRIAAEAPPPWQTGVAAGKLGQIVEFMQKRQESVAVWFPQVEAWING